MFCQHSADGSLCSDTVMESESSIWMAMWSATSREPFLDTWRCCTVKTKIKSHNMHYWAKGWVNSLGHWLVLPFTVTDNDICEMTAASPVIISGYMKLCRESFLYALVRNIYVSLINLLSIEVHHFRKWIVLLKSSQTGLQIRFLPFSKFCLKTVHCINYFLTKRWQCFCICCLKLSTGSL